MNNERYQICRNKGEIVVLDTDNEVTDENLEMFGIQFEDEYIAKYIGYELKPIVNCLNEQNNIINKKSEKTLSEIIEMDLNNVVTQLIEPNKDKLSYDKDCCAWFIGGEEIVDELWYDCYTILHPKEIIGYIEEYIEDVMGLER